MKPEASAGDRRSDRGARHPALALAVVCLATLIFAVDVTVLQIANATIQRALHFHPADLQWLFTAYALTYGGLLLLGGRVGDVFGHRRLFLWGMAAFGVASLAASLAHSPGELIAARAVQGVAAALAAPSALALIANIVPEGAARHRAYGTWGVASSAGGAIGYFLGGIIVGAYGWEWAFLINLPIAVLTIVGGLLFLPSAEERVTDRHIDVVGAVAITASLGLLVYALARAATHPWLRPQTAIPLIISVLVFGAFLAVERRSVAPLIPARLLHRQAVSASSLGLGMSAVIGATIFFCSLYVQQELHFSAGEAGAGTLGVPIGVAIGSRLAPAAMRRWTPRRAATAGLLILTAGIGWMALTLSSHSYAVIFLPGWPLLGVGLSVAAVPLLSLATDGVAPGDRGLMAGAYTVAGQIGGVVGLAVLSSIAAGATAAGASTVSAHGIRVALSCAALISLSCGLLALVILAGTTPSSREPTDVPTPSPIALD